MKLVYSVVVGVIIGSTSYLWAQTLDEREIRERVVVIEEKITNLGQSMTNLDQKISNIEARISSAAAVEETQWICQAICNYTWSGFGNNYKQSDRVQGTAKNRAEAFGKMLNECNVLAAKLGGRDILVTTGTPTSPQALVTNSCCNE